MKKNYFILLLTLSFTTKVLSQISLTGPDYSQDFNTLSNTAGSTTNVLAITGWLMTETGGGARDNEQYAVDNGGSNTGDTYSYGPAAGIERAFGCLRSGTLIPILGAFFTNNTGVTLNSLTISYTGEEWRLGTAARTDRLDFQYSLDATGITNGTWTDVNALDFTTPVTATAGAKDGNNAANRTVLSSMINGISIPNGTTFYIRWNDLDATGADDGLGIDDFTLSTGSLTPVTLINFAVTKKNATSRISWTTTQEVNSREFNVQRLTGRTTWETIATVPAKGNSSSSTNYLLYDLHPANGINLYRLQSVDLDSKFYLSDIRRVNFDRKYTYSLYPNPAKNKLQITADHSFGVNGHLLVLNTRSQIVLDKQVSTRNPVLQLDISFLKAGLYILTITAEDGEINMLKFVRL
jgi:hypothetical protein